MMDTKIDTLAQTVEAQGKTLAGLSDALQALIALQTKGANGNGNGNDNGHAVQATAEQAVKRSPGRPPKAQQAAAAPSPTMYEIEAHKSSETNNIFLTARKATIRADGTRVVSEFSRESISLAAARQLRAMSEEQFNLLIQTAAPYTPKAKR